MNITVNGDPTQVDPGTSIEGLLATRENYDPKRRGIAIARNGEVVPRGRWTSQQLAEGDIVELLTATQGG
ncbi:MAG: Sulfur carrier protein ThiS, Opine oxidase subunit [Mycobacterium sp.]|jgi:sulfur carrier protein|nr:Sulfur carrier protein ThiS, Opine oxidase subunit [Mycobacterium sp.]